jgi:hypothetical protein
MCTNVRTTQPTRTDQTQPGPEWSDPSTQSAGSRPPSPRGGEGTLHETE